MYMLYIGLECWGDKTSEGEFVIKPRKRKLVSQDENEKIIITCAVFDPD